MNQEQIKKHQIELARKEMLDWIKHLGTKNKEYKNFIETTKKTSNQQEQK